MTVPDYAKAFTDFWTAQTEALLKAQQRAGQAVTEGMKAFTSGTMPGLPSDLTEGAAEMGRASQSMMEMWTAATAMSGAMTAKLPVPGGDTTVEAVLARIADPRQWLSGTGDMDEVLGRMAEGPRFADLWEIERRYARVMQAWMAVRRRGLEHNAVVLEAWMGAGRRFMEELGGKVGAEARHPDSKAILALWTDMANQQLLETQRSEAFLTTQREMIRASTELRLAQGELVEHFGKQYGFPTRTELDDVHRTVTELRREVRLLKREQRRAAGAAPVAAAPEASGKAAVQEPAAPPPTPAPFAQPATPVPARPVSPQAPKRRKPR